METVDPFLAAPERLAVVLSAILACCGLPPAAAEAQDTDPEWDFHLGAQGFVGDFSDYPPADEAIYELTWDHRVLPSPLAPSSGLFISGINRSDDLFMFFRGSAGGLTPGAKYRVTLGTEIATDVPAGCFGIGGAPGESVYVKAGASDQRPVPVLQGTHLRTNIDVGNQSQGGANGVVLGNLANSRTCEQPTRWERKSFRALPVPAPVTAAANGRIWLLYGVDSGFEGRTGIYFTRAWASFERMDDGSDGGLPEADFTVTAECADGLCRARTGAAVTFEDVSAGVVRARRWDFGDGRQSRSGRLSHAWSSPGFYEVTLWTSDGTVESTASRTFLVEASDPAGTCVADGATLCLRDSRYAVAAEWRTAVGETGVARVVHRGTNESGLFRFFGRENWEILIKVLDGCDINGHVWVYGAATTDLGHAIRVTDTATGASKEYRNEPGRPAPAIADATAFPDGCRPWQHATASMLPE